MMSPPPKKRPARERRESRSRSNSRSSRNANNMDKPIVPGAVGTGFQKVLYEKDAQDTSFFVMVEYQPENIPENSKKRINELKLYSVLKSINLIEGFKLIKRTAFRSCKIQFDSAENANKIINAETDLKKLNLRAYIPIAFTQKFGVIREVPKDFTDYDLLTNIVSEIPIKSVTRFTFKDRDNEENRLPTNTVKIAFRGNKIPEKVYIHSIPLKVHFFIPRPKQCRKCGRMGHLENSCKNTKAPCLDCGKIPKCTDPKCETSSHVCLLCGSKDHTCFSSNAVNCVSKREHQEISRIMAMGNLSYKEVRETYNLNNRFELLDGVDYEVDFPDSNRGPRIRNNLEEINKSLTRHTTFSSMARKEKKTAPPTSPLFQAEPLDYGNQSYFSIPLDKTTDAEKFIQHMLKSFQQQANLTNNLELSSKIQSAKNAIQNLFICNDQVTINTAINKNGPDTSTEHTITK